MTGRAAHARRLLDVTGLRVGALAIVGAASAGQALLVAPAPFLVQRAFEAATRNGTHATLALAIAELVALLVFGEALTTSLKIGAFRITKPGISRLRARLGEAVTHLPIDLVEPQSPYVHDVYVHDTERVDVMLNAVVGQILPSALLVLALSAALAIAHPAFGLATMGAAIIAASAERVMRRKIRRRMDASHRAFGEFSRGAWSMLSGIVVTRSHGAELGEARARAAEASELGRTTELAARASAFSMALGRGVAAVVFGGLLLIAGGLVQSDQMTIPAMLAITSTIALLRSPLYTLGQSAPQVQEGWRAWGRIAALLDAASGAPTGGDHPPERATLTLERVACRFGHRVIFDEVSLSVAPGELVALTGPNGAGKTTLVRQILGLTRPSEGTIRIGSVAFERVDMNVWRQSIGVVLQETWFFDGSIFENLIYGAPYATREAVAAACAVSRADDFVRTLPDGLQTRIGTDGLRLSQGQRQRLAIARALVRHPRLLILDEPTNHLDEATSHAVMHDLVTRVDRPATLLITHQPEFAMAADRVLRLADGRLTTIEDTGTLREIMRADAPLIPAEQL